MQSSGLSRTLMRPADVKHKCKAVQTSGDCYAVCQSNQSDDHGGFITKLYGGQPQKFKWPMKVFQERSGKNLLSRT